MVYARRDLDFWVARLHGRRSRLAEGARLHQLCRLRTVSELARNLLPDHAIYTAPALQRRLISDLANELAALAHAVPFPLAHLVEWQGARLQLENIKLLARGVLAALPLSQLQTFLVEVPAAGLACDFATLSQTTSWEAFVTHLPPGLLPHKTHKQLATFDSPTRAFLLESALDQGYLSTLLERAQQLDSRDWRDTQSLIWQEIDIFHTMLAVRGNLHHGLNGQDLIDFHIPGTPITRGIFTAMLQVDQLSALWPLILRRVMTHLPATQDASGVEIQIWHRYWQLANRTFRRSHVGSGAVVSYAALRRIEVANLIRLSEGLRMGLDSAKLRPRMMPYRQEELNV